MCSNCHDDGEKAIALVRQMIERHPSLTVDARIKSDQTLVNLEIHHIDRAAQEAS